jgi:hypothetical protein
MQMIKEQNDDSGCVQPAFTASALLPAVLCLTLKKKWFDMIASGEKKEEYREIKMYWWKRLVQCGECYKNFEDSINDKLDTPDNWKMIMSKTYDYVQFKNGYSKGAPTLLVECTGIKIDYAKKGWCPDGFKDKCFVIQLGNVVMSRV